MRLKKFISVSMGCVLGLLACDKIEEGYLSDNIYYAEDPFTVEKGVTTYSEALQIDQSTSPMDVELLDIRNVATGKTEASWLQMREINVWKSEINVNTDTTYELIMAKLSTAEYLPFRVNPVGGRLEFTAGTTEVPDGDYEIDLKVSNIRGSRILKNACLIKLVDRSSFYEPAGTGYWDKWNVYGSDQIDPVVKYAEVKDENKIAEFKAKLKAYGREYDETKGYMILKVLDHYGNAFSWVGGTDMQTGTGEFRQREYARGTYEKRAPWETMVYTDNALVAEYGLVPFPIINGDANNGISYYRIPAEFVTINKDIQVRFSWRLTRKGIFEITYQMKGTNDSNIVRRKVS